MSAVSLMMASAIVSVCAFLAALCCFPLHAELWAIPLGGLSAVSLMFSISAKEVADKEAK